LPAGRGNNAKKPETRGSSQVRALSVVKIFQSLFRELVEPTRSDVLFKLSIPLFGIEFSKPGAERRQIFRFQVADGRFDFSYCAHSITPTPPSSAPSSDREGRVAP